MLIVFWINDCPRGANGSCVESVFDCCQGTIVPFCVCVITVYTDNPWTWKSTNFDPPSWDTFPGDCMLLTQSSRTEQMFLILHTQSADKVVSRLNKSVGFLFSLLRQLTEHYLLWLPLICDCLSVKCGRTVFPTPLNDWQLVVLRRETDLEISSTLVNSCFLSDVYTKRI